jgi:uncharacterized membrane protein
MSILHRLVMFSDAVIAIAITILAIELRPPHGEHGHLGAALLASWPKVLSFAISFLVIAGVWLNHVRACRLLVGADHGLVWITLARLAAVAFLPYPTAVLGESGPQAAAVVFYAGTVATLGLAQAALWGWIGRRPALRKPDVPARVLRVGLRRSLTLAAVFGVSIPVAYAKPLPAMLLWILLVPAFTLAGRLPLTDAQG